MNGRHRSTPRHQAVTALVGALLLQLPADAEIRVDADFPGGSGVVQQIDQKTRAIRLMSEDHPGRGWRCWWYVKLTGS